jgi:hypothetical protein
MYRGVVINFELLFLYRESYTQADIYQSTYKLIIDEIQQALQDQNINAVIGLLCVDGFLYKNTEEFYSLLKDVQTYSKSLGIKKLSLVVGICAEYQHELDARGLEYEIIEWDFSVNSVYQSYKSRVDKLNQWNPHTDKFLFLTGVPSRPARIGLLSKFYDAKMLDRAEWSFFSPWTDDDKKWCRAYLSKYTDNQYTQFLLDCDRKVDDIYSQSKDYSRLRGKELADLKIFNTAWCKDHCWIDPEIFKNTSLSIISEGSVYPPANDYKFLTEKTWRAVIQRHPFILADHSDRINFMKSKGLHTFEEYLPIKNYCDDLDAVVTNTKYFIDNVSTYQSQIAQDIEHNYNLFFNIVNTNNQLIEKLKAEYSLNQSVIDRWFSTTSSIEFETYLRIVK